MLHYFRDKKTNGHTKHEVFLLMRMIKVKGSIIIGSHKDLDYSIYSGILIGYWSSKGNKEGLKNQVV